jgi:hypothetical protein
LRILLKIIESRLWTFERKLCRSESSGFLFLKEGRMQSIEEEKAVCWDEQEKKEGI